MAMPGFLPELRDGSAVVMAAQTFSRSSPFAGPQTPVPVLTCPPKPVGQTGWLVTFPLTFQLPYHIFISLSNSTVCEGQSPVTNPYPTAHRLALLPWYSDPGIYSSFPFFVGEGTLSFHTMSCMVPCMQMFNTCVLHFKYFLLKYT